MKVIGSNRVPIKAWIDGVELEDAARQQLLNVAGLPFVFKHVDVCHTLNAVVCVKG